MTRDALTEIELKAAVLNHLVLHEKVAADTVVASELPLGRTSVRADLVVLSRDNQICGIEIKSDRDSLARLERQLSVYQDYFDRVIVVVGSRHIQRVLRIGFDAEVWLAHEDGTIKRTRVAPALRAATKSGRDLLSQRQAKRAGDDDRQAYCDALRARFSPTSAAFWNETKRRRIEPSDLRLLSRFEDQRAQVIQARLKRESMWAEWADFLAGQKSVHSSSVS